MDQFWSAPFGVGEYTVYTSLGSNLRRRGRNQVEEPFQFLSCMNDAQLSECFRQHSTDLPLLNALSEELKGRRSEAAAVLHFEVVSARRVISAAATLPAGRDGVHPIRHWLSAMLRTRGLSRPQGTPLYRYRLTDTEYGELEDLLRALGRTGQLLHLSRQTGGVFVAYCAEWFRRKSASTFLRWEDVLPPHEFGEVPYQCKRSLTETGLEYWQRPLRESSHAREFLLSLALEGGFPVQVLREGAKGWLKDYLRALVRRGLADGLDSAPELEAIAGEDGWLLRDSYRRPEFLALCSELAMGLIDLRREAEKAAIGGIASSILLDKIHPDWRLELPIYVPPEDQELADALLKGLIDEKIGVLSAGGLEARRYLVKRDGQWMPAAQVLAVGEISTSGLGNFPTDARARAVPAGELGNHIASELALLEPPAEGAGKWRVRPFSRTPKLLLGFLFAAPVAVTLISPTAAPQVKTWPRGEPLRSDLLVFREDEASTKEEPLLRFIHSGSVSSQATTLYALFPREWTIEAVADAVSEIEDVTALGRRLAKVTGTAYFGTAEYGGSRFHVATGEEEKERELFVKSLDPGFELVDERWELAQSGTFPSIKDGRRQPRAPGASEIFVRRPGQRWQELDGALYGEGAVELSWRDPNADIQLEKRRLVLMPAGARISGRMNTPQSGEITLTGMDGWSLSVKTPQCETKVLEDGMSVVFQRRPLYRLPISLGAPGGETFDALVSLKTRDGIIALADGTIVKPPHERLDPGRLRGGVASAPQQQTIELSCHGTKWASVRVAVEGDLPLSSLREAVQDMFAVLPTQDEELRLSFIGDTRPAIRISRYRYEQPTVEPGHLVRLGISAAEASARPVAKMILDPRHEHALEADVPPFWRIPERCKGPSLVYVRDEADVLSRPVPVGCTSRPGEFSGRLVSALAISDHELRSAQLAAALQMLATPEADPRDFSWLSAAVRHLNGLPANAFDALKLLPSAPCALVRLLLKSGTEQRPAIWALQHALPFLWLSLPAAAWRIAFYAEFESLVRVLTPLFDQDNSVTTAATQLQAIQDELLSVEPGLEATFALAGMSPKASTPLFPLLELARGYVRGQHGRDSDDSNDLAARLAEAGIDIPPEFAKVTHTFFAGLFAPLVIAAAAQAKLTLSTDLALLARRTIREDPAYVSQAYRHLLKFYT